MSDDLQYILSGTDHFSFTKFDGTLFGKLAVLVGVDASGLIVVRQALYTPTNPQTSQRSDSALQSTEVNATATYFEKVEANGVPYARNARLGSTFIYSYFKLEPLANGLNFLTDSTGSTEHTIVAWYLIGLVSTNSDEHSVTYDPERQNGVFGLGATIDEAREESMTASNRLWLKWTTTPTVVNRESILPFRFTEDDEGRTPLAVPDVIQSLYRDARALDGEQSPLLATSVRSTYMLPTARIFGDVSTSLQVDLTEAQARISRSLEQRAKELFIARYGNDVVVPESPLKTLPVPHTTLYDLREGTANRYSRFWLVRQPSQTPLAIKTGSDFLDASALETPAMILTREVFTFPETPNTGLKITVTLDDNVTPWYNDKEFIVVNLRKIVRRLSGAADPEPVIQFNHRQYEDFTSVGGQASRHPSYLTKLHFAETDDISMVKLPKRLAGDRYELYLFEDGTASLYVGGQFVRRLILGDFTLQRGAQYGFEVHLAKTQLEIKELKAEAFEVPSDYTPYDGTPQFTAVVGINLNWSSASIDRRKLKAYIENTQLNHDSSYYGARFTRAGQYLEMTLTHEADLEFYYYGTTTSGFKLTRLDAETPTEYKSYYLSYNTWSRAFSRIPAGRYRLMLEYGKGSITGWRALKPIPRESDAG